MEIHEVEGSLGAVREGWFIEEHEPLTPREREVLQFVADGYTNDQIAEILYKSPHTVKVHIERVREKLHARNRAGAVAAGFRSGIID